TSPAAMRGNDLVASLHAAGLSRSRFTASQAWASVSHLPCRDGGQSRTRRGGRPWSAACRVPVRNRVVDRRRPEPRLRPPVPRSHMTLTQLRYLVAIADAGLNITLAAERVHATQPGLSKQLKQLEDELGFLLFARKGRSLEAITPAGAEVLERARVILAEAANIRADAANERGEHSGRLLLATTHTQARYVLPPVIAAIRREFPQVDV